MIGTLVFSGLMLLAGLLLTIDNIRIEREIKRLKDWP